MSAKRFRVVYGCDAARFIKPPAFSAERKFRGSKWAGILFERKVGKVLDELFPTQVIHNCWLSFEDMVQGERICSPDHLLVDTEQGVVTIVECKLSHTTDAWRQINDVYVPVVKELFPSFEVRGIEVCKYFSSGVIYPEIKMVKGWGVDFTGTCNVMVGP